MLKLRYIKRCLQVSKEVSDASSLVSYKRFVIQKERMTVFDRVRPSSVEEVAYFSSADSCLF